MPNYNKVIFIGHLTRDPEVRYTSNDKPVANFGIAVNDKWGEREDVMFIDCDAWNKTGELIAEHLRKGDPIMVEGRLKLDQWEDQQGAKRSRHKVTVDSFTFVGGGGGKSRDAAPARESSPARTTARRADPVDDDEIPF